MTEDMKAKVKDVIQNPYISSDESASDISEESDSASDDDSGDEQNHSRVKVLRVKKLTWRSLELSNIFSKLDKRVNRKRSSKSQSMVLKRIEGPASSRLAPDDAPAWALA